jgi:predicted alpha/beta-hydrolase family hydrolase
LKKVLIVIGRETLHKDSILYQQLFSSFDMLIDPSDELTTIQAKVFDFRAKIPFAKNYFASLYSKWLKLHFIFRYRDFSGTYLKLYKPHFRDFEYRKVISSHFIKQLQGKCQLIIVGRSAGALIATQIADSFNVKHVICIGYPFKHPNMEEEPHRTQHLSSLKTPTTIYQGTLDEYGKPEDLQKYSLSNSIKVVPLETTHDYLCSVGETQLIINQIKELLQAESNINIALGGS